MTKRGWLLFLAVSVMWGLPYFMIRVAVRDLDPFSLVFARTLPAALVLLPIAWRRGGLRSLRGKGWWILLYTVVEFGIPWLLITSAERHISSSLASLMVCATPSVSILIAKVLHPNKSIGRRRIAGVVLGVAGVATLVGLDIHADSYWWILAMLVVAAGYAAGPAVINAKLRETSGLAVIAVSVALVALLYAPVGIARWPAHVHAKTFAAMAVLVLVCTIGAFVTFFVLIREVGPSKSTVVTYLNTAVAVFLGVVFLREPLTLGMLVGFPVIVVGSYFATSKGN